jgi:hypothetical protein
MRILTSYSLAVMLAVPAVAQRPTTWRCANVLCEDGKSWRHDMVVTTLSDRIIEVRAAESDGDPLADIKNLRRVAAIVFEGQVAH